MEEIKKQLFLLISLIVVLFVIVLVYRSDKFWNIAKGLPFHTNSGSCVEISDKICLSEDSGLRVNYYEASSLCSKRGMKLPSLDDAWEIWTASENCHMFFTSNENVPKNKNSFFNQLTDENPYVPASKIRKYCKTPPIIKFPIASQYKGGNFWLKDGAGAGKHYAINYNSGRVSARENKIKTLGVRCVKLSK